MTVKDLVEKLRKLPQDNLVVVRSYESGYDNLSVIRTNRVVADLSHSTYEGYYQSIDDRDSETGDEVLEVIILE